ncbi:MAG: hypothetical protein ACI8WA_000059, partial [Polaribacter sp.]
MQLISGAITKKALHLQGFFVYVVVQFYFFYFKEYVFLVKILLQVIF